MSAITTKDDTLAKLHQLPAMPAVVQEVIASFRNADPDVSTLAHKIAQGQGLSARVLRVANSAFYSLPRTVGSILGAAGVAGFNSVRSLVLSAGFVHAFPPVRGQIVRPPNILETQFPRGGLCALAQCLRQDQQMAFTAGMFFNIGLLVLDVCIPE